MFVLLLKRREHQLIAGTADLRGGTKHDQHQVAVTMGIANYFARTAYIHESYGCGENSTTTGTLSEQPQAHQKILPKNTVRGNYRTVKIDQKKLRKGRFFVSLPDGMSYEAVRVIQQERGKGRFAWVGHASDDPENRVVIGVSGDAVAGTFSYRGKLFRLEPRADGSQILSEVTPTDPAPELDPIAVADAPSALVDSGNNFTTAADANGAVIDVLVAYTPAVQALYGSAGAEALILQAVAEANQAYANSGMATRLNLVHSVLTNYAESSDMNTDLTRLRGTGDGYMDELHALRNQYGADVVNLIEIEPQYCGLAYRMATLSSSFASSAFSVVHAGCATGYYSFAHEIGHNQGAHHDYANATGGTAIYPYAYGFPDPNHAFRTIMSYNCIGGCTRIGHFSNSGVLYNGRPTGYAGSTENAMAIDNTAATVASFRQSATLTVPLSPASLSSATVGPNQIDLRWSDRSTNESGYLLERSLDGLNFTQVAALTANTTSYRDENLTPSTLYQYRARAWNSSGNSGYSNVTTVATDAAPQYVEQHANLELSAGGQVDGTTQNTASEGGAKETITEITYGYLKRLSYLEHYWLINVQAGKRVTLFANVGTTATSQSFTFAYSTVPVFLAQNKSAWIDMFTVSANTPKSMQFDLPSTLTGPVYISVRDNERAAGTTSTDSLIIDYLAVRTEL
ncbi:MAG: zinc-dependent metalloprotease family protein [Halioglobus sp.]